MPGDDPPRLTEEQRSALARLEQETATYYDQWAAAEVDDDLQWAKIASRAARALKIDD
jgi:hypothetical protein